MVGSKRVVLTTVGSAIVGTAPKYVGSCIPCASRSTAGTGAFVGNRNIELRGHTTLPYTNTTYVLYTS